MTDSIANANGQGPTTIMRSGGEDYILAPLRMEDMGLVEQFAKERHRKETMNLISDLGDLLAPEEKKEWLTTLKSELSGCLGLDAINAGGWTWMSSIASPTVITYAVTLRLRKTYPEMTEEEAKDIITAKAIAEMEGTMGELLGLNAFGKVDSEDGEDSQGEAPSG